MLTDSPNDTNLINGNKSGRGGARAGAGAKPKAATILRKRLIENKVEEADASFAFLVAVRDNDTEPIAQRVEAAKEILDRVLGRSRQQITADVNSIGKIEITTRRFDGTDIKPIV